MMLVIRLMEMSTIEQQAFFVKTLEFNRNNKNTKILVECDESETEDIIMSKTNHKSTNTPEYFYCYDESETETILSKD